MRTTRSGEPEAIAWPNGSAAIAYTDALGPEVSGGLRVISGEVSALPESLLRSQRLMVRSKDPDATHDCSRLAEIKC
jgi:hypothetical protein